MNIFSKFTQPKNDKQQAFIKMASHDLRNQMSTIKWYTEMLIDGDMGTLTEDQKKCIITVRESNQKALDLIASFSEKSIVA
jgi:light-regulated signal transduction histidine kinase (bacteriophytochrome)